MGDIVVVAYKPKDGQKDQLLELVKAHVPALRDLNLATDRTAHVMSNKDGTIIEIFEWKDGAIEQAHSHPAVQDMWEKFATACDYVPLNTLPEAADLFAEFKPIEF